MWSHFDFVQITLEFIFNWYYLHICRMISDILYRTFSCYIRLFCYTLTWWVPVHILRRVRPRKLQNIIFILLWCSNISRCYNSTNDSLIYLKIQVFPKLLYITYHTFHMHNVDHQNNHCTPCILKCKMWGNLIMRLLIQKVTFPKGYNFTNSYYTAK